MNTNLKVYSFLVSNGVLKKNDINPKQDNTMLNGEEDVGEALKNSCIKVEQNLVTKTDKKNVYLHSLPSCHRIKLFFKSY